MARDRHALILCRSGFLAVLWYFGAIVPALPQSSALEIAVKATYLYKIAAFITWPPVMPPPTAFNICIVGNDPFGPVLDQAIQGQTIAGLPIVARRFRSLPDQFACQMIYLSDPGGPPVALLAAVRSKPAVTVTDGATDPAARGIINFVIADNRVRFEIDNGAAIQSQLTISSKLLGLAVRVSSGSVPGGDR